MTAADAGKNANVTITEIERADRVRLIYRHRLVVRICHWIGAVAMVCLFMSGLQIFNAHPALYWGQKSTFAHPVASIEATRDNDGKIHGTTNILGHDFNTTGMLGLSGPDNGSARAFPSWITLPAPSPSLSQGRRFHFFFAWVLAIDGMVYLASSLINRHLQREIVPHWSDIRHLPHEIKNHARLRFPKGDEARHYNGLQKLTYFFILCLVVPVMILAGLAMSPHMDAGYHILLTIFDGRQSARTVHFLGAFILLAFFIVHIAMVVLSGVFNNLRSMITGWYAIDKKGDR